MAQLQRPGSKGDWDILSYTTRVICAELCQLRDPDTWGKKKCLSSKKSDLRWRFFKLEPQRQLHRIRWGTGRDQISLLMVRILWMSSLANVVSNNSFIEELLSSLGQLSRGSFSMQEVILSLEAWWIFKGIFRGGDLSQLRKKTLFWCSGEWLESWSTDGRAKAGWAHGNGALSGKHIQHTSADTMWLFKDETGCGASPVTTEACRIPDLSQELW